MNKFSVLLLSLFIGAGFPLGTRAASPVKATVVEGSFHCFPQGAPVEYVSASDVSSDMLKVRRVDKLGNSKWDNTDNHDLREIPTEGSPEILVILVQFKDVKFSNALSDPQAVISDMLNGDDFTYQGAAGSARAFYSYTSAGKFTPVFNVVGPVTCAKNEVEYVSPSETDEVEPGRKAYPASRMIEEAIKAVDEEVDFSKYDSNGDGVVDFVYVFFAGRGATTGGSTTTTVWPHAYTLTSGIGAPVELDGVKIDRYCCSAEIGSSGRLSGIGTFCHEFGHVLGLPDLYDTANNNGQQSKCFTPGTFDCMDGGNYNNNEHSPATFSLYEQYALEWTKPVELTGSADVTLLPLSVRPFGYKVSTEKSPGEYFLFEARGPIANDRYLEGHGLLVWHIDFLESAWKDNKPNNVANHQRIDIEEADFLLDRNSRSGDVYPGTSGKHEFQSYDQPAFADWNGQSTGYEITRITRNPDGSVSFTITSDRGNKMMGMDIAQASPEIVSTSSTNARLRWNPVAGAGSYMVSVYDLSLFDGKLITEYVDGFCYRNVDQDTELEITGLEPGKSYGVYVYALNESNASRNSIPVEFTTRSGESQEFPTNLYVHADNGDVTVTWDTVEGADDYDIVVALPLEAESSSSETVTFDGNEIPSGWSADGNFENRGELSGESAPSFRFMTDGNSITTSRKEESIRSISFWASRHYDDDCMLDIYGIGAKGEKKHVARISDLTKKGAVHEIYFPEGMYQAHIVFVNLVSGQSVHFDDMTVKRSSQERAYAPLTADRFELEKYSASAVIKGLDPDVTYAAYVTPLSKGKPGARSNVVLFTPSKSMSSVEMIEELPISNLFIVQNGVVVPSDESISYNLFTVDGLQIATDIKGEFRLPSRGIFILRAGSVSSKLRW